jgi:hypothetical protein
MSIGQRLRHEVRQIGLVALYFFGCFVIFLSLKKLLLEEYHIPVYVLQTAVLGAIVVAKVVVILEKTSFASRFQDRSLIAHSIWRSLAYTAVVFVVTLAEELLDAYLDKQDLAATLSGFLSSKQLDHFLAMNVGVALSFMIYFTFSELDRRIGHGAIRRLLFSAPPRPPAKAKARSSR